MNASLRIRVVTPSGVLLDVPDAEWVQAQLADGGGIGIWPGHAPLLAETVAGKLAYADGSGRHAESIEAGVLLVRNDIVTVLTLDLATLGQPPVEADAEDVLHFERLMKDLYSGLRADPEQS